MATRTSSSTYLGDQKVSRRSGKSPSRSPAPNGRKRQSAKAPGYASEGVRDNDIFNLPGSDWQLLSLLTVIATVVRLFRISQPSSVVFDEVQ
jgi:dolichyl-phosphate-mannose-protein mannosyltransferase